MQNDLWYMLKDNMASLEQRGERKKGGGGNGISTGGIKIKSK